MRSSEPCEDFPDSEERGFEVLFRLGLLVDGDFLLSALDDPETTSTVSAFEVGVLSDDFCLCKDGLIAPHQGRCKCPTLSTMEMIDDRGSARAVQGLGSMSRLLVQI